MNDGPAPRPDPPRAHRPLLDLFPLSTGAGERPPKPGSPTRQPSWGGHEPFYGLDEKPFALSSDPKFFYRSTSHDRALSEMLEAIHRHEGVVVLTGGLGLGKTTLCRAAARELDRRTVTSIVFDPFLSIDDLLKTVLVDFGVISRDDLARATVVGRDVLTAALGSFLESLVSLQANAVIMIDEAQRSPAT